VGTSEWWLARARGQLLVPSRLALAKSTRGSARPGAVHRSVARRRPPRWCAPTRRASRTRAALLPTRRRRRSPPRPAPAQPLFLLCIKAELDNVASVALPDDAIFVLDVKNPSGDDVREGVRVSPLETHELTGSRGEANFRLKWARDARHEATLNVQAVKGVTRALTAADAGKFVPVAGFECRGLEPVGWRPENGFTVTSAAGTRFEEADLSEREWADYCEKGGDSVSVMELEYRFETHKEKK
jgi:hypothetical protein